MFTEERKSGEAITPVEPWRRNLLRAADLIEKHGHAKFELRNERTGALCIQGAIMAAGGIAAACQEYKAVGRYLREFLGVQINDCRYAPGLTEAVKWNNARERTQAEVIAALRGAAEL